MFEWIAEPSAWIALATLTLLEIVLGIDNIIFISILASRLPKEKQPRARRLGLGLALIVRVLLLFSLNFVARLTYPVVSFSFLAVVGMDEDARTLSWRDILLATGGLFLLYKAVKEIHAKLEGEEHEKGPTGVVPSMAAVLAQIAVLDIVFSLDSVITAVGMADQIEVMVIAVIVAVGVMLFAAGSISDFVERYPTVKMLALAFLVLIGVNLLAEGFGQHIPKGYTYFALAFSMGVEFLNIKATRRRIGAQPVHLRQDVGMPHVLKKEPRPK